jgi:hypothetical protein
MTLRYLDEMTPLDDDALQRIIAELERRDAFRDARMRLTFSLRRMGTRVPVPPIGPLDMLCPPRSERSLRLLDRQVPFRAPWGWVWVREPDRAVARLMPKWLAYPHLAWHYCWWVLEPFARARLLEMDEGGWWHTARPRGWARLVAFIKREWPGGWDAWREAVR